MESARCSVLCWVPGAEVTATNPSACVRQAQSATQGMSGNRAKWRAVGPERVFGPVEEAGWAVHGRTLRRGSLYRESSAPSHCGSLVRELSLFCIF